MNFWNHAERYYTYKFLREGDKVAQNRKKEKLQRKREKELMIAAHGHDYYCRDKLWNRIKNQKKKETYETWKRRLSIFKFTVTGYDMLTGEYHPSKPLVHEYNFKDAACSDINYPLEKTIKEEGEKSMSNTDIWSLVKAHAGEQFYTVTDKPFVYEIIDNQSIKTSRTDYNIHKSNFEKAMEAWPVYKPSELPKSIMGPSYVFAIMKKF